MDPQIPFKPDQSNFDLSANRDRSSAISAPTPNPKSDGIEGSVLDQVCVAVKSIGNFFIDLTQNHHEIHGNVKHLDAQINKAQENIDGAKKQILDRIKVIDKKCSSFFTRLFVNTKDLQAEKMKLELLDKKLDILIDRADDIKMGIDKKNKFAKVKDIYEKESTSELKDFLSELGKDFQKHSSINKFLFKILMNEVKITNTSKKLYDALLLLEKDQRKNVIDHILSNAGSDKKLELMEAILAFEVQKEEEDSLFRDSKVGMLIVAHFQENEMHSFLEVNLVPVVQELQKDKHLFEINDGKVRMGKRQLVGNQVAIQGRAQNIFDIVKNAVISNSMPLAAVKFYKSFYNLLKNEFEKRGHPDPSGVASKQIIASLFLRLINPALTTPKKAGLANEAYNEHQLKNVMYMTKLLQNLANRMFSSSKEPFMKFSQNFVKENLASLDNMVAALIK